MYALRLPLLMVPSHFERRCYYYLYKYVVVLLLLFFSCPSLIVSIIAGMLARTSLLSPTAAALLVAEMLMARWRAIANHCLPPLGVYTASCYLIGLLPYSLIYITSSLCEDVVSLMQSVGITAITANSFEGHMLHSL
jgi:hypothetical protein